jgi:hypothetical protein
MPAPPRAADPWSGQLIPADHLAPWSSAAFVYGVGCIGLVAAVTFAAVKSLAFRRRARQARASFRADAPLVPGSVVLHGKVECEDGVEAAVRVEIEQEGKEEKSEGQEHVLWTEVNRTVVASPFYVIEASGRRVRVEPGDDVLLLSDGLSGGKRVGPNRRRRVARLRPGQSVFASGEIVLGKDPGSAPGAYRDQGGTPILRPPRGKSMVLSTVPLGKSLDARARVHQAAALVILLAGGFLNCVVFRSYFILAFDGVSTQASITKLETIKTHDSDDGTDSTAYRASLAIAERGITFEEDMTESDQARMAVGQKIPARYASSYPMIVAAGGQPTIEAGLAFFITVCLGVGMLVYGWAAGAAMRWYDEDRKVVDRESGTLE